MKNNIINVSKPSLPRKKEYFNIIKTFWKTKQISNYGQYHQKLELDLKRYLKQDELSIFTNGHIALESALETLSKKGEIITTPFTFASTTHAIMRTENKPVFCDIEKDNYTIDVRKVEKLINDKTVAILPVHVYGNICEVDKLEEIAKKHNLTLIYDAAHVFGVEYKSRGIASFGDICMFSFHATKVFHTAEGGALTYNNPQLKTVIDRMKNFGIVDAENVDYIGSNAKMDEFRAALGIINLRGIDKEISKRKSVVERYFKLLGNVKGIKLNSVQEGVKPNYAYMPVLFDGFKKSRDQVLEELKAQNIFARKYFYPLTTDFDCYKEMYDSNQTPIAKHIAANILTLPLYGDLPIKEVDRICNIILS